MQRDIGAALQPRWLMRGLASAGGAAMFVAPLLALVLIWAIAVPLFGINPRVSPRLPPWAGPRWNRSATVR
jgi:hypothetical protein